MQNTQSKQLRLAGSFVTSGRWPADFGDCGRTLADLLDIRPRPSDSAKGDKIT
jgi:hypothetical protein